MKNILPYIVCGLLLLASSGCGEGNVVEVEPTVPDSIMIQVLIELHLAEARTQMLKENNTAFRDSILTQYNVSREDYETNMAYYHDNPDVLHELLTHALDELSDERYMQKNAEVIE